DFFKQDSIALAQDIEFLTRDVADDAHRKTRPWERMPPNDLRGKSEHFTERANLILEEKPHRFDEFEAQLLRQTTDVVVQLDVRTRSRVSMTGFDHVGVERSLRQELHIARNRLRRLFEDVDESVTDAPPLLLRLNDALEITEELTARIDNAQIDVEVITEGRLDKITLILPEQTVVDENAHQLFANRFREERRNHRTIDATRKPTNHLRIADARANTCAFLLDKIGHLPRTRAAAGFEEEVRQHVTALRRVCDFRVELHPVEVPRAITNSRKWTRPRARNHFETLRNRRDLIAVAHPHGCVRIHACEEIAMLAHIDLCAAELAVIRAFDLATEDVAHQLHAVANAEDWKSKRKDCGIAGRRALLKDARRTTGEDDALRCDAADLFRGDPRTHQQTKDTAFAHATGDQLRRLAAEVEDEDRFRAGRG
ncbi:MAG: hypothetical protein RIR10_202, partial [Planctomycetota bacterium]